MVGVTPYDLPWPEDRYRIDLHSPCFETKTQAACEDAFRAKRLRKLAATRKPKRANKMRRLADQLDPKITSHPTTLASSRFCRLMRIKLIGAIWRLIASMPDVTCKRFDVVKTVKACSPGSFWKSEAARLRDELRADLLRAAKKLGYKTLSACNGTLQAILHGEILILEQQDCRVGPHFHMVVSGDLIAIVNSLREQRGYAISETTKRPIISSDLSGNFAYRLSYLFKSYWPAVWRGLVSGVGKQRRSRKHGRLPEPHHTNWLFWIDRQRLSDLCLNIGVFQNNAGYVLSINRRI